METKDFKAEYINVTLLEVISYDTIILDINYSNESHVKECSLFRVSKDAMSDEKKEEVTTFLKNLIHVNNKYKAQFLDERRSKFKDIKELLILYNLDLTSNINDSIINYIKSDKESLRMKDIIAKIRLRK